MKISYISKESNNIIENLKKFSIERNDDFYKISSSDFYFIDDSIFTGSTEEENNIFFLIEKIKEITIKKRPLIIVFSNSTDIKYIVKLMRSGVSDILRPDNISEKELLISMQESYKYLYGKTLEITEKKEFKKFDERINIPKNVTWENLENNKNYDLTLMMITIFFSDDVDGRYSISSKEKIIKDIMDEFSRVADKFGGILWFWSNDSGTLAFHFGDHINCGVLAGIYIATHFNLFCIEKLKINELINIKISIHTGTGKFNRYETQNITSDLLNSLVHLQFQYKDDGNFYITDDVYKKLSNRISNYFEKTDFFEGKQIFSIKNKKM